MAGPEDGEKNKETFEDATVGPSKLRNFDVMTPVGLSADGENAIIFTTQGNAKDVTIFGFQNNNTAFEVESYTGANSVGIAQLSPDGIVQIRAGAVAGALSALPADVATDLIVDGREIVLVDPDQGPAELSGDQNNARDIEASFHADSIDPDLVDYLLEDGDIAFVLKESLNASGSGLDTKAINEALAGVEIARIIPEHTSSLVSALQDPEATQMYGLSVDQANQALEVLSGDAPSAFEGTAPAVDQTLEILPPPQQ